MAGHWGGRARGVDIDGLWLDNGQHILIGAYARTLALMATVGVDIPAVLQRLPLELRYPDGRGLRMPAGPAWLAFGVAIAGCKGWSWADRWALLRVALGWVRRRFDCPEDWTVHQLCAGLPPAVRQLLIDPLCVAALNTPASSASAKVFLRVLRDAIFGPPGSADLLLPRRQLDLLLPSPATAWLQARGATLVGAHRVQQLQPQGTGWDLNGTGFDGVILACSAAEAARLTEAAAPAWSAQARSMAYEPIITVYLRAAGLRLPSPMAALVDGAAAPAQFAFDLGALGGQPGVWAFVVSGARSWIEQGLEATGAAVLQQALAAAGPSSPAPQASVLRVLAERRATFRCTPGLLRAPTRIAPALVAAGDYVQGPYPATLEGAVRSAEAALALLTEPSA
jgi:squalene-associated FAD-dependent desaturase